MSRDKRPAAVVVFTLLLLFAGGCVAPQAATSQQTPQPPAVVIDPLTGDTYPTPQLEPTTRERRQIPFTAGDVTLAGELDLPRTDGAAPLAFIIHHSGPVGRDAYGYMAELLTAAGFAVFRFDKRGVGASGGEYGCCEAEDALAAYRAAVAQDGIDRQRVFIVAQSIGTEHLAAHFADFAAIQPPVGVLLLSSLLGPEQVTAIAAPVHIIVADSEPNLDAVCAQAVQAHQTAWPYGATCYVAAHSEHTLFDISAGPIDWSDPGWVNRYHRGAMQSLIDWLQTSSARQKGDSP
jgi:alpha/beta superfamily hydrolase